MELHSTLAAEVLSADGARYVSVALRLVLDESIPILTVDVAFVAVLVLHSAVSPVVSLGCKGKVAGFEGAFKEFGEGQLGRHDECLMVLLSVALASGFWTGCLSVVCPTAESEVCQLLGRERLCVVSEEVEQDSKGRGRGRGWG